MRFEKGHKGATRHRIIAAASERFRQDGVAATGIAGVMEAAGLTHGGFYAHFPSKEDLVRVATASAMQGTPSRVELAQHGLEAYIRTYLRTSHRDAPGQGCAAAALAPEIARASDATRADFAAELDDTMAEIAARLPPDRPAAARWETAIAIFGVMLGTLQLARAVPDKTRSDRILSSGIQAALQLAGLPHATPAKA